MTDRIPQIGFSGIWELSEKWVLKEVTFRALQFEKSLDMPKIWQKRRKALFNLPKNPFQNPKPRFRVKPDPSLSTQKTNLI